MNVAIASLEERIDSALREQADARELVKTVADWLQDVASDQQVADDVWRLQDERGRSQGPWWSTRTLDLLARLLRR